jgi:hypothetical protein
MHAWCVGGYIRTSTIVILNVVVLENNNNAVIYKYILDVIMYVFQ